MKKCSPCKTFKVLSDFHKNKSKKDGYSNCCKACHVERVRKGYKAHRDSAAKRIKKWRATNRERVAESCRKYRVSNPDKVMWADARHRSEQAGIPFDIEVSDINIPETCPILGISLHREAGRGGGPNSPSIDRLIPELGYVKGNVAVISQSANSMKYDYTLEQLVSRAAEPNASAQRILLGHWAAQTIAERLS